MVGASASGAVGRTKGGKNGTDSSLADARNKRVVPGRYKKAGVCYLLCCSKSSTDLMLTVQNATLN